ncbi:MAG: S-layer homology domain-containing protein, partial [Clostridia bacterium]|nr:S-layer homology domain-containing protein [Clostridia bacterium]
EAGTPNIALTIGSSTVNAAYVSGSGTTALTFQYTIVSGNIDADGIVYASPITLPEGATIRDAAGNDANPAFTPPPTSSVLVDGTAPTLSSAEIVSGNSYIDIVFSEGVYGAGDGTTALTKEKLALTFTQNSGSATGVMISSIKKNDNASEASASDLTGGETTVRVFLSVTGSASGTETIEIKPANASSVYDNCGNSMASTETTGPKTLHAPVSYGSDQGTDAEVIVNGKPQNAGTTQTTTDSSGQTTTTVTVDTDKLQTILANQSIGATVTIPITGNSDVAAGTLTGAMVKSMEDKDATLVVQTASGSYTLPASEIDIDAVSQQLGTNVSLSDINVTVSISEPSASMTKVIENAAQNGGFTIMVPAVEYTITCTHGSQTADVSSFDAYVERTIAIPDGVDPAKITTGVVVDPDGTTHHVPTRVALIGGKYYAVINSLTNSTYSVVWNSVEFSDVVNHWAKDAINDMGSRMVVTGVGNNNYAPDRNMTRAEFAAIIVRALGLEPGTGASGFSDVTAADWYSGYIKTAASYGIIKGYDNGKFGPNDTITREQAMTMIARAMTITKLSAGLTDSEISQLLSAFSDGESASSYAKGSIAACIKTGITSGTSSTTISPKAEITRAEVAVMVQRLLQKSGLI